MDIFAIAFPLLIISEAISFAILLTLLTMRFKLRSRVLDWLGINAFAIYILQRLPMLLAKEFGLIYSSVIYFAIILTATMLLAGLFTKSTNILDRIAFSKNRHSNEILDNSTSI